MLSLTLALALPLLLPFQRADEPQKGPTPEQVKASVARLEAALEKEEPEQIAAALQAAAPVPHPDVVKLLAKRGLGHGSREVQRAAIESLGRLEHSDALASLHKHAKRKRKQLRDDLELYVPLLQAIARHGDESSISVLTKDLFINTDRTVIRARVLGLARIRSKKAVEAILDLMKKAGRNKVQPFMNDFQLALAVLTHVDQGTSQDLWLKWWNANKKTFEVQERAPKLPEAMQTRWDRYWGERPKYERQKRRGRRGNDPEDDK
jgi:HEAT repeats